MITLWSDIQNLKTPSISTSISGDFSRSRYHLLKCEKKPFLIQFPISNINCINRNWLSFQLCSNEKRIDNFIRHFSELNECIYKRIESRYNKPIHWDERINSSKDRVSFNACVNSSCIIYNETGERTSHRIIDLKNSVVEFIVQLSRVQLISPFDDETILYGKILLDIVQIRHNSINIVKLESYSFQNTIPVDNKKTTCAHKDYKKYFDMLKMGVPRKAVEQRIIAEGLDIGILDGKISSKKDNNINQLSILDLKNCKLKKTEVVKHKKVYKMGFGLGISFEDIQNRLKSLRKTHLLQTV
mgnify:CR=1 FL=1|tara:strand:- start:22376 stop:23275 length:900 start_codon:yes stop_codon:yes gene_type:complete